MIQLPVFPGETWAIRPSLGLSPSKLRQIQHYPLSSTSSGIPDVMITLAFGLSYARLCRT